EPFLDYVISHGVELVGPYGLDAFMPFPWMARAEMAVEDGADGASAPGAGESGYSTTNVQVEGVDEPDIVKTDGERLVLMSEGELIVVDVTGDSPVVTGRLALTGLSVQSLFLSGDTALLFGSMWSQGVPQPLAGVDMIAPVPGTPTIQIIEVDISGEPEVLRTMTIDGAFVSGRMVDDSVRLVLQSGPVGFEWSYPSGSGLRAERTAIEENRQIIRESTEENWIPYYVVTDADGQVSSEGTLIDCERVSHPEEFSGLDMLSVVTIDIGGGLDVIDSTGVLATGDTVYASADSLFVATQDWGTWTWLQTGQEEDRPEGPETAIHMFDISDAGSTSYVASGSVDGYLLNQFAMDEHEGMLRVASTTAPNWWGSGPESESRVTVLRPVSGKLIRIGTVQGLGLTEQIYSVRFLGDVAYVVTFRQTDPLYTIDLSNPRDPRMVGELKIPGYSAYLHPIGENLVLGVGQDATDEGAVQGSQVSVFDVSDITDPTRVDVLTLGRGTSSQVEYDHHAFLYWDGLTMIPVQQWSWDDKGEDVLMGAVGVRIDESGDLSEVGEVVHPGGAGKEWDWRAQIMRTVVVGDSVYTISAKGLMKSGLDDLGEEAWIEF
ncbi:MAG TPA: beta-propeller domain-containing protein, partial [Acidimicrobiia bacterium]